VNGSLQLDARVSDEQHGRGEVDARFLLANERTLLAWLRTGLTLIAAGVAARQLDEGVARHRVVSVLLLLLGTLSVGAGGARYVTADRALRSGRLPGTGRFPLVLVAGVAAVGVGLLVATLVAV
jgi:putative membrane protein